MISELIPFHPSEENLNLDFARLNDKTPEELTDGEVIVNCKLKNNRDQKVIRLVYSFNENQVIKLQSDLISK